MCAFTELFLKGADIGGVVILVLSVFGVFRAAFLLFTAAGNPEMRRHAIATFLWAIGGFLLAILLSVTDSILQSTAWGASLLARCGIA